MRQSCAVWITFGIYIPIAEHWSLGKAQWRYVLVFPWQLWQIRTLGTSMWAFNANNKCHKRSVLLWVRSLLCGHSCCGVAFVGFFLVANVIAKNKLAWFLEVHTMRVSIVLLKIIFVRAHTKLCCTCDKMCMHYVLGAPDSVKTEECLGFFFCMSSFQTVFFPMSPCWCITKLSVCVQFQYTMNNLTINLFKFYPPLALFQVIVYVSKCILIPSQMNEQVCFYVCYIISRIFCWFQHAVKTARAGVTMWVELSVLKFRYAFAPMFFIVTCVLCL